MPPRTDRSASSQISLGYIRSLSAILAISISLLPVAVQHCRDGCGGWPGLTVARQAEQVKKTDCLFFGARDTFWLLGGRPCKVRERQQDSMCWAPRLFSRLCCMHPKISRYRDEVGFPPSGDKAAALTSVHACISRSCGL